MAMESLRAALLRGGTRRSPLFGWLWDNRADFQELLDDAGARPDWKAIAEGLAKDGLLDGNKQPPTGETVRQTWWKVKRQAERVPAAKPTAEPQPVTPQVVGAASPKPAEPPDDDTDGLTYARPR